jgi:UDP-glucose 4-epimerase
MRILVTGGNGSLGRALVPALLSRGHQVTVLDPRLDSLQALRSPDLTLVEGGVEDAAAVAEAVRGAEVVVHMAWSFSEDPATLIDHDLRGHQVLLAAAREHAVRHLVYLSTAVVYGKPIRLPIDEEHPLRVLEARKPAYGIAKEFAENLALLAAGTGGPPVTVLRFWWAFGETIGGRHLRDLMQAASSGHRLSVPAESGGSFLTIEDLISALTSILLDARSFGQIFNLASAYVTWEEVAAMVLAATGSHAGFDVVAPGAWTGPAFLADPWQLDDRRIRERLGFRPLGDAAHVRALLARAIRETWRQLSNSTGASR